MNFAPALTDAACDRCGDFFELNQLESLDEKDTVFAYCRPCAKERRAELNKESWDEFERKNRALSPEDQVD